MTNRFVASVLALSVLLLAPMQAHADKEQMVVDDAAYTAFELVSDPDVENLRSLLDRTHGVVVIPQLVKAGFIIGGEVCRAVILACDVNTGERSYPAFPDVGSASVGLQAGPAGADVETATTSTDLDDDIHAYGTGDGLFIGISIEGTLLIPDEDANMAYYGEPVTTREIIQGGEVWSADADILRNTLKGSD
ncbi:MAG: lipid-binding SYLF domain-containing protein [Rhodospirillales bacterium]|nr:lipid-binding SYLF domain-containing protein [Rhodospirillales bacterium]